MQDEFERLYVRPKEGRTLIVGSRVVKNRPDRRKLYPDAIGVDLEEGEGVDRVLDMEGSMPNSIGRFSHVECASVLEHSKRPWLICLNVQRLLEPGGTLYVAAPFAWRIHNYPGDYFRFTTDGVKAMFSGIDWRAAQYVSYSIDPGPKLPLIKHKDVPHLARSMACLFGVSTAQNPVTRSVRSRPSTSQTDENQPIIVGAFKTTSPIRT